MIINTAQGGGGSSLEVFNFPLTISLAEPTPIATGHLWVVHDGPVDFSSIVLDDAVKVDYSNGYLMLIVDDTNNGQDTITQNKKIGSAKVPFTSRRDTNNDTVLPWQVGSVNKGGNIIDIKRKYPRVYSRLNGVLDLETAYVWDGTQWVMVSQKGSYLAVGAGNSSTLYNRADTTLTLHSGLPDFPSVTVNCVKWSPDGRYLFYGLDASPYLIGYKRSGDGFTKITLSNVQAYPVYDIDISSDSRYLLTGQTNRITVFKLQSENWNVIWYETIGTSVYCYGCCWHPDGNSFVATIYASSAQLRKYKKTDDTITSNGTINTGFSYKVKYSPDGDYVALRTQTNPYLFCYHIVSDTQWDKLSNPSDFPVAVSSAVFNNIIFTPSGYLIALTDSNIYFFTYSSSALTYVKTIYKQYAQNVAINFDGTKLAFGLSSSPYLRWYSLSGMDLTEFPTPDALPTSQVRALNFIN